MSELKINYKDSNPIESVEIYSFYSPSINKLVIHKDEGSGTVILRLAGLFNTIAPWRLKPSQAKDLAGAILKMVDNG